MSNFTNFMLITFNQFVSQIIALSLEKYQFYFSIDSFGFAWGFSGFKLRLDFITFKK